jgi:hypothetical protein
MGYFLSMSTNGTFDSANNRTYVAYAVALNWTNGSSFYGMSATSSGYIEYDIGNGNVNIPVVLSAPGTVNSSYTNSGFVMLTEANSGFYISHNNNGQISYVRGGSAYSGPETGSLVASDYIGNLPDYDRRPATPSFQSITRSIDTLSVATREVSSPAGAPTYYVQRSENGGGWADQRAGRNINYSGLAQGTSHRFRVRADNSDGQSSYSAISNSYQIPSVPSGPSTVGVSVPSGRSLTVTSGPSSDNGASISGYFCQSSSDNGSSWGASEPMGGRSLNYSGLDGGSTYRFRTFSSNEMGDSAKTTSPSVFISSGGRRSTPSGFVPTTIAKRWSGSSFVDIVTAKRWSGSTWVDLS